MIVLHESSINAPSSHYERIMTDDLKSQAVHFLKQLVGWCSDEKASLFIDLVVKIRPNTIVEIGVFGGSSLIPMACALRKIKKGKIYGIDPWDVRASLEGVMGEAHVDYWNHIDHEDIYRNLLLKIKEFALEEYVELIKSSSENAEEIIDIDLLHIDGNHSDKASYLDVTKWVPYVKPGGWIIFDDIAWDDDGLCTTARAVKWLDTHCIKFAEFEDNSIWGIWIKP